MTTDETAERARTLLDRVQMEPDSEAITELYDLVRTDDRRTRKLALNGLRRAASRAPGAVADVVDVSTVRSLYDHEDPSVRAGAVALRGTTWAVDEEAPGDEVAAIEPLLSDEQVVVRSNAVGALTTIGSTDPAAVVPVVDDVDSLLDDPGGHGTDAVRALAQAATADGTAVRGSLDRLFDLVAEEGNEVDHMPGELRSERNPGLQSRVRSLTGDRLDFERTVRQLAGHAIVGVAIDDPDAVLPRTDDLAALLDDPDPQVQAVAADVFVALADGNPEAVRPHADALATLAVDTEDVDFVQTSAVEAVAAASTGDPEDLPAAIRDRPDVVRSLLDHDRAPTRGAGATLLAILATEDPSVVEPVSETLRDLAADDEEYVQAAAADALQAVE